MSVQFESIDDVQKLLIDRDVTENLTISSIVPQLCQNSPCMLGIDEAGRGPVLGPMVYGAAFCPVNQLTALEALHCADSKALTEERREEIFASVCKSAEMIGWSVELISPTTISNGMLRRSKHSLNAISMESAIGLIRKAERDGVRIAHIFVDTVGKPETYQAHLLKLFPDYKITVAKKADSTYPIVSAASICAKVIRDRALQVWQCPEKDVEAKDFGSGYPNDPATKKFLLNNCDTVFGYPQLVRFSWSTAETALDKLAYFTEWEEPEEEEKEGKKTAITLFFKSTKAPQLTRAKHEFFVQRHLSNTVEF